MLPDALSSLSPPPTLKKFRVFFKKKKKIWYLRVTADQDIQYSKKIAKIADLDWLPSFLKASATYENFRRSLLY